MPMMNNPSVMAPNGGNLMVTAPAAAPSVASQGGDAPQDPRIYRPKVNKNNPHYKSLVRMLPRGRDLGAYPYVCVLVHHMRDVVSGETMTVKCCKNIPGVRNCPYCEDIWGRYNAAKTQPGADKNYLKRFLSQLAEEEWYGNVLVRQDENHPELNGQVKVWPHSKFQHAAFQTPVDKYNEEVAAAANPATAGAIQVDTGNAFVPYDPVTGYDYVIEGVWEAEKTFGDGRKGAPSYKLSTFVKNPSPIATSTVVDPNTGMPTAVLDENTIYAVLDQCHDLKFVYEDVPNEQQAVEMLSAFWDRANKRAQQRAASGKYGAPQGMPQQMQQSAPVPPNYGSQPFQTGTFGGQQFGNQNSIPQVPSNAKISTSGNPAAFMGQPAQPAMQMPAAPAAPAMAPAAPAAPAFAAAPAAPAMAPAAPAFAAAPAAPAMAPAAPAAPAYVPPAAPPVSQPVTQFASPAVPQAGPVAQVETTDDDDLPF